MKPTEEDRVDFGFQKVPAAEKARRVGRVFESVAQRYDVMNDLMSFGSHRIMKRIVVEMSGVRAGHNVLDLAGGTGDFAALYAPLVGDAGKVVLADINGAMMEVGRDRLFDNGLTNVAFCQADAEALPFADNSFNCITIGFGLRNVTRKERALAEMHRVLRPNGRLLVLEFSKPENPDRGCRLRRISGAMASYRSHRDRRRKCVSLPRRVDRSTSVAEGAEADAHRRGFRQRGVRKPVEWDRSDPSRRQSAAAVSPFATLLTRWAETLANESTNLDSLTLTRLRALSGRSIAIVIDPPGETTTLQFSDGSIRVSPGAIDTPSVIVRGAPVAFASAFLGSGGRGGLTIDGDEIVLSQFRSIVHDYRPDVLSPLENLVGKDAAQVDRKRLRSGILRARGDRPQPRRRRNTARKKRRATALSDGKRIRCVHRVDAGAQGSHRSTRGTHRHRRDGTPNARRGEAMSRSDASIAHRDHGVATASRRVDRPQRRCRRTVAHAVTRAVASVADALAADAGRSAGTKARLALETLGPVFIKFGQILSTRRDLLAPDYAEELAKLQDRVPPFPGAKRARKIQASLGVPLADVFASFDEQPLASASVAQVHAARLLNGDDVVVKVVRPGIESVIREDLLLLHTIARLLERVSSDARRLHLVTIVEDYQSTILNELNLIHEGANTAKLRRNFADSPLLYVPRVYWDHTREDVLVLERIHGVPIANIEELRALRHRHEAARGTRRGNVLHAGVRRQLLPRRHAPGEHLRRRHRSEEPALRRDRLRDHRHADRRGPELSRAQSARVLQSGLPRGRAAAPRKRLDSRRNEGHRIRERRFVASASRSSKSRSRKSRSVTSSSRCFRPRANSTWKCSRNSCCCRRRC